MAAILSHTVLYKILLITKQEKNKLDNFKRHYFPSNVLQTMT